jgi:hypothetical protein
MVILYSQVFVAGAAGEALPGDKSPELQLGGVDDEELSDAIDDDIDGEAEVCSFLSLHSFGMKWAQPKFLSIRFLNKMYGT